MIEESSAIVFVFRHGDTDKNKYGDLFYGVSLSVDLSKRGRLQLWQWGRLLRRFCISSFYCSPLKRARQSVFQLRGGYYGFWRRLLGFTRKVVIVDDLTDVAYPLLEGRPVDGGDVVLEDGTRVNLDEIDFYAGEPLDDAGERFAQSVLCIARENQGNVVALVSHGDPIALGLFRLENPDQPVPSLAMLAGEGRYLQKGEGVAVRVSYPSESVAVFFDPMNVQLALV